MVIRVATFNAKPEVDPARMAEFRAWMKGQPGFVSAWHARDTASGKSLSISVWRDREAMLALKNQTFPGPRLNLVPDLVEIYDDVEPF